MAAGDSFPGLVFVGEAGIGKTALWETGIALAREAGFRVLSARPTDAEVGLSFAALADLLDGVDVDELAGVPGPSAKPSRWLCFGPSRRAHRPGRPRSPLDS